MAAPGRASKLADTRYTPCSSRTVISPSGVVVAADSGIESAAIRDTTKPRRTLVRPSGLASVREMRGPVVMTGSARSERDHALEHHAVEPAAVLAVRGRVTEVLL